MKKLLLFVLTIFSAGVFGQTDCPTANSLCTTIGVPFANTTGVGNADLGIDYDCLGSQPNPTWFYLPIGVEGNINIFMSQTNLAGNGLDVDFIAWGPFADPVCGAENLNENTKIACSYSAAATESFLIENAQPGEFYMLMVTNFSNSPGQITIDQTGGSGEIVCTGIRLNAFLDADGNGLKDAGEPAFPQGQYTYEKNGDGNVHNVLSPSGTYIIHDVDALNTYDVTFAVNPEQASFYSATVTSFDDLSITAGNGFTDYFFPVVSTLPLQDLAVSIVPNQQPQPGFSFTNTLVYSNLGNETIASGTVTFTNDPLVTITAVSEAGYVATPTGFTFEFTNLLPFQTRNITVTMLVPIIPTVELGDFLTSTAGITLSDSDNSAENNASTSTQTVIGSFDPNDKMESRGGQILISDFTPDDYLYYTIRFENSGTAAAQNVVVLDVLDSQLDENSVRMVSASHDYVLDMSGSTLNFNFADINLAPVNIDFPEVGHGYIHFKVKPRPGYAVGDIIPNTASIFFDFNPAIVTNTFNTEFVATLGNENFSTASFVMYPNPAGDQITISTHGNMGISGIAVYDMLGKSILATKTSGTALETLDVSGISSGMYFVEVTTSGQAKEIRKLVIR